LNDKLAKRLRKAARESAPSHLPERVWYAVGKKSTQCVLGPCIRDIYHRFKRNAHLFKGASK